MKYTLSIKAEAIQDMADAFDWYENERAGLGVEFLDEVDQIYDRIIQAPKCYQPHRDQRIAVLHRFSYKIIYMGSRVKRSWCMQSIMTSVILKN